MKIKRLIRHLLAFIPTRLPGGMTEFQAWADDIIDLYGAPSNDSVRFSLATMILNVPQTVAYKSKLYFGLVLKKAMANQVASAAMYEYKEKQKAAQNEQQS